MANVLVKVLQGNRSNRKEKYMEIYFEELAHTIMEAEKSQDLLSASWRPRKGGGVI